MGDITTREEASTSLKRDWFYKDKDVARPVMSYEEICVVVDMLEAEERKGKEIPTELYAKMMRSKHLIEERRIKGDKK
jgi:hypothetical protein